MVSSGIPRRLDRFVVLAVAAPVPVRRHQRRTRAAVLADQLPTTLELRLVVAASGQRAPAGVLLAAFRDSVAVDAPQRLEAEGDCPQVVFVGAEDVGRVLQRAVTRLEGEDDAGVLRRGAGARPAVEPDLSLI